MNPSNLDGIDFLQIVSIVLALFIGFLPNIKSLKDSCNRINRFGALMIVLFSLSLVTAFISTAAKSASDKENYQHLFDSTLKTLKKSNETVEQTSSLLILQDQTIRDLKSILQGSKTIQEQGLSLSHKTDSIQQRANELNKKLGAEIILQEKITKISKEIVQEMMVQEDAVDTYNNLRFMLNYSRLISAKYILYDGLQEINHDMGQWVNELNKTPKSESKTSVQLLKIYHDSLQKLYSVYFKNTNRTITFAIKDSSLAAKALKDYFNFILDILETQFSNPSVYKNTSLLTIWMTYHSWLYEKQNVFLMDKQSISSLGKLKELVSKHDDFLTDVLKHAVLKVALK